MADVPLAIVLAVGGAAAGGPEALGVLLGLAGRSAAADVAICVFLICAATVPVLGTMLLVRYLRVAGNAAPATERFARMTLAVALAVVLFVTACLLAAPAIPARRGGEAAGAARFCYA
ncbi:hypothetical protein ACP70R_042475 [Stipagrostis hirtigluma subsp. patula]